MYKSQSQRKLLNINLIYWKKNGENSILTVITQLAKQLGRLSNYFKYPEPHT